MLIAWPTHNRDRSLVRSVKSFLVNDANLKLVVSSTGENSLSSFFETEKIKVELFEGQIRRAWISLLSEKCEKKGIDPELIRFALNPESFNNVITTGANRNFLLLKLVGQKFISVDDDVTFEARRLSKDISRNRVSGTIANPLSSMNFSHLDELIEFKEQMPQVSFTEFISAHFLALSFIQHQWRCGVSISGYYGDSGFQSPRSIFSLGEDALREICNDKETLDAALKSRLTWRVSEKNQMHEISPMMLVCAGFSNDYELPPFFPLGRNQDGAYGYALNACVEKILIGHIDIAINHSPLEERYYPKELGSLEIRINDVIALIWLTILKNKAEKSYIKAAEGFKDFSNELGFKDRLLELVKNHFHERAQNIKIKIDKLTLEKSPSFAVWTQLAEKEIGLCKQSILDLNCQIPVEARMENRNEVEAIELTRQWIHQYADLLHNWKLIRHVASTIK